MKRTPRDTFQGVRGKLPVEGRTRFVYAHRDDIVAQAVSWLRAEQTGARFLGGSGEISGAAPTRRPPQYGERRIAELVRTIEEHTAGWETWFASAGVTPHRVRYEDLAADPVGVTRGVLAFLGLSLPEGRSIAPRHRRQADGLNEDWARRHRGSGTT